MRLLKELQRRNVFKVATAYGIVAWLLLEGSDTLVPALRLPEWFQSGVVFILILGFPIAMIFAWAFEMTPEGLRREKTVDPDRSVAAATGQKLNQAIIALLVVALAYFAWDKFAAGPHDEVAQTATGTAQPRQKSIAVIPFRNRSANEENAAFFSDGIHDELLTNLSKIKALKVISRTSVMGYRDTTKNLRQIGRELGVANILEGGVQRAGDTVRINVQLIDTATDAHLWANVYERKLTAENIFAIQKEIAEAIANALEATLSPQEQERLADIPTTPVLKPTKTCCWPDNCTTGATGRPCGMRKRIYGRPLSSIRRLARPICYRKSIKTAPLKNCYRPFYRPMRGRMQWLNPGFTRGKRRH